MSTTALEGLLSYLYGTLSPSNMQWVGEHLIEYAKQEQDEQLRPYTMEELNARIDQAEAEIAAGKVFDADDVWRELEEEFSREDAEEDTLQLAAHHEKEQFVTA